MNNLLKNTILILANIFILGCSNHPTEVLNIIDKAGSNKTELLDFLNYYKHDKDPLKYKAACFLVANMDQYSCPEINVKDNYNRFFNSLDSLIIIKGSYSKEEYTELFQKCFNGAPNIQLIGETRDIHSITSAFLKENLEYAFLAWKNQSWSKQVSFDDFCEFILPYRFSSGSIEDWRLQLFQYYNWVHLAVKDSTDPIEACMVINEDERRNFSIDLNFTLNPIGQSFSQFFNAKKGVCDDAVNYSILIHRALGIAVTSDYTPFWAKRSLGHSWNVILNKEGKMIDFLAASNMPGLHKLEYLPAKVFRKMFSKQKEALASKVDDLNTIPSVFRYSNIKDVTQLYCETADVTLKLSSEKRNKKFDFAYLNVFSNLTWCPIYWGKCKGSKVTFNNMGKDIVYLPSYFINDNIIPFSNPIILTKKGVVVELKPDEVHTQKMILKRKYSLSKHIEEFADKMINGEIQISDQVDVSSFKPIFKIERTPKLSPNVIHLSKPIKTRYIRYYSPDNGNCTIAELSIYDKDQKPIKGRIIGMDAKNANSYEKVFDGDHLSFYESTRPAGDWVGLDFGHPVEINYIVFVPRNDLNNIEPGNIYELFMWNNGWQSMGRKQAEGFSLMYNNIPSNGLYWLRNLNGGKEERIFTYENDEQVWW